MPGGRKFETVWIDGKPPRYWSTSRNCLIVFFLVWVCVLGFLPKFGSVTKDSTHSSPMMYAGRMFYFPPIVIGMMRYGLFIMMGWMLFLGIVAAFKRTMSRE